MTFGGMFRRTTMYESIGGLPPAITLGVGTGDPAGSVISLANIPGLRQADLTTAQTLYAFLTGRISSAGGSYFLDEDTLDYRLGPAFRREEQNVGGLFAQDQWRVTPQLTVNYGMRWEFSGAMANANEVYSGPTVAGLYGPSTEVFQPGVLNGDLNPQIFLRPKPYKGDFVNPAPNVGMAWNPEKPGGFLGKLLGQAVYRANFGINYYDEGLIPFQTANGNGPGLQQTLALPTFAPGSLSLQGALPAYSRTPTAFAFPITMGDFFFSRGFATTQEEQKSPDGHKLDARIPARAVARRSARDSLRRQPRQQPVAVL